MSIKVKITWVDKKKKNYAFDCTYTSIRDHTHTKRRRTEKQQKRAWRAGLKIKKKGMSTITWPVIINDYMMRNV